MPQDTHSPRFTGRHMAATLCAFFGVVFAVNFLMARLAISSFGGTVVDNSYVASQHFNKWLAAAEAQEKLGWTMVIKRNSTNRLSFLLADRNGVLNAGKVKGEARHPLGQAAPITLSFDEIESGQFLSKQRLPSGRWQIALEIEHEDQKARLLEAIE